MPRRGQPRGGQYAEPALYEECLDHLKNASKDRIVVCDHKKDSVMLTELGVHNCKWHDENDVDFVHKMPEKEIILLFDTTRPGNKRCQYLRSALKAHGCTVNTRFRKILFISPFKEIRGMMNFIHKHAAPTPRKHESVSI